MTTFGGHLHALCPWLTLRSKENAREVLCPRQSSADASLTTFMSRACTGTSYW